MKFEILLATKDQKNIQNLINQMNIHSDVILANQTKETSYKKIIYNEKRIEVFNTETKGVGINRNIALMNSKADIALLADDDIEYNKNYEEIILNEFEKHPKADIIIFNLENRDKERTRYTIKKWKRVRKHNCLRYGAVRIAFKTDRIKEKNIYFSLLFGGGAKYSSGEDSLFILECIRKHLKIFCSPQYIGIINKGESSWFSGYNEKFFYDKAKFFKVAYGKLAYFICIQQIIRHKDIYCKNIKLLDVLDIMRNALKEI